MQSVWRPPKDTRAFGPAGTMCLRTAWSLHESLWGGRGRVQRRNLEAAIAHLRSNVRRRPNPQGAVRTQPARTAASERRQESKMVPQARPWRDSTSCTSCRCRTSTDRCDRSLTYSLSEERPSALANIPFRTYCGDCTNLRMERVVVSMMQGYSTLTPNSLKLSARALSGRPTTLE